MTKKFTAKSPDDLVSVARELIRFCADRANSRGTAHENGRNSAQIGDLHAVATAAHRPALIFLSGPLGAGKTKFVQTFVHEASRTASEGVQEKMAEVASPTFALHQQYQLPGKQWIHHFDLYRLESEDEIENVGLWDVLASRQGFVFIEWPEKIPGFANANEFQAPGWSVLQMRFEVHEGGVREIEIRSYDRE